MRRSRSIRAARRRTCCRRSRSPGARSTPCRCPPPCTGPTGSNSGSRRASMPRCRHPPPMARSSISAASCTSRTAANTDAGTRVSSTWCRRRGPMSDGALAVSKAFVDSQTGVTITAVSKGQGGLTVTVASPQTHGDPGIYRKLYASSAPVYKFFLDYGFGPGRGCEDPARHGRRHSAGWQFHQRRAHQHRPLPQRHLVLRHQS